MEPLEFNDVEVLSDVGPALVCRIGSRQATVPVLLIQPGSEVRRCGDRGRLVIPKWLAIGLGVIWPFDPPHLGD